MSNLMLSFENDMKNVFRDKSLFVVLFIPIIIAVLLRIFIPIGVNFFPVIQKYSSLIVVFFCTISAFFPAYAFSFVTIDERDQKIFPLIGILPGSIWSFIRNRLLIMYLIAFVSSIVIIVFSNIITIEFWKVMLISLVNSASSICIFLAAVSFSKNKIEALSFLKAINVVLVIPVTYFLIPIWVKYVLLSIPVVWIYLSSGSQISTNKFLTYTGISTILYVVLIFLLFIIFKRKVIDSTK